MANRKKKQGRKEVLDRWKAEQRALARRTLPPPIQEMQHEILGAIKPSDAFQGDGIATIEHESRKIQIHISPDGEHFKTTLKLAEGVVTRLKELDRTAKRIIVRDLRDCYNGGWNEYQVAQEDGSVKTVRNPQLSERDFETKFSLIEAEVVGKRMIDFIYEDSGLFWGHSVIVTSLSGIDFSDAEAELFG